MRVLLARGADVCLVADGGRALEHAEKMDMRKLRSYSEQLRLKSVNKRSENA